jgi:hypothetical protein
MSGDPYAWDDDISERMLERPDVAGACLRGMRVGR